MPTSPPTVKALRKIVRKRWFLTTGLILFTACALIVLMSGHDADPTYHGKRLSTWLRTYPYTFADQMFEERLRERAQCKSVAERREMYRQLTDQKGNPKIGEEVANAYDALLHSGQDAFPVLLRMVEGPRDSVILRNRLVEGTRRWLELTETIPVRIHPFEQRSVAITAFLDLQESGCDMDPALPGLKKLTESPDRQISHCAKSILDALALQKQFREAATNH